MFWFRHKTMRQIIHQDALAELPKDLHPNWEKVTFHKNKTTGETTLHDHPSYASSENKDDWEPYTPTTMAALTTITGLDTVGSMVYDASTPSFDPGGGSGGGGGASADW